ncbi:DUF4880 domain-containing protein [Methylosinus trichosporium OB3b]|uniref:DUF4880 domain-containing protein n=2 Tax=Methylocystaceae TaxID=31993 RepID=A0A2D2D226_METT3|nr:DUF4880 domain-containing protein [Methylosinus trichosporium OB3b]
MRQPSSSMATTVVHDDPIVDGALEWFARLRNEPVDATMQAAFEHWCSLSPRHAQEYRDLEAMWGSTAFRQATEWLQKNDATLVEALESGPRAAEAGARCCSS